MDIKYFISHNNENIMIFEVQDNKLVVLKKDGEESHLYDNKEFWSWWEHKTVYKNEEVSFLIATELDSFEIPQNINIAKKNTWKMKELEEIKKLISFNQKILTFPEMEKIEFSKKKKNEVKSKIETKPDSIQAYFQNKTQVTK